MKFLFSLLTFFAIVSSWAQSSDVWGKAPEASDDRFTNPQKPLYAGPDGWFNTGEVRATLNNAAKTAFGFTGGFNENSGSLVAVKDLQTLYFDFGAPERPAPGTYQIGATGSLADKTVKLSFGDVSKGEIKEWSSGNGAGTLTISLVNGFTYFTCRNVTLQPSGLSNKGETDKPMTLGFEGAVKLE